VFLNDWGAAVAVDKDTEFEGALQHAPNKILACWEHKTKYKPAFSDDLEMIVRSVFHSVFMVAFREIEAEQRPEILRTFWKRHLAPPLWQRMVQAARACDYATLTLRIAEILPRQV
jgi:macrodomain Ter protein organizer (MatP/YcbG family)